MKKKKLTTFLLKILLYVVGKIFSWTCRYRYFGLENLKAARSVHSKGAYCLACWHENALAGIFAISGMPHCFLISRSTDGDIADFLCRNFHYETARGSSSRGGKEARMQLLERMAAGIPSGFTVDGPRGPRHQCKPGIVKTAVDSESAILPIAGVSSSRWVLKKTWDQTRIPKPFSKILFQFGPPVLVEANLSPEDFAKKVGEVEQHLHITEELAHKHLPQWEKGARFKDVKALALT